MDLPGLEELRRATDLVRTVMPPTPTYTWPLLNARADAEVWVKHENHSPVGAFKLRGATVYMDWLTREQPHLTGVIAATRGNHGQGVALAARSRGLTATIVVPHGNSREKNRAMRAQGAELIEHGHDFQEALEFARPCRRTRTAQGSILRSPARSRYGTYALEMFLAAPPLETVYVPIGLGSSICGVTAARNALGLKTKIVGVVAAAITFLCVELRAEASRPHASRTMIADGLACRTPNAKAMEVIWENVARIVEVSENEIAAAMRALYEDTHNLAEGAAAALAGALKERG